MGATRRASLDVLELHVWPRRAGHGGAFDLAVSRATPRRGAAAIDVGLFFEEGDARAARSTRTESPTALRVERTRDRLRLSFEATTHRVEVDLALAPVVERRGTVLAGARGRLAAFDRTLEIDDAFAIVVERHSAHRPYAWASAVLRGEHEGAPLLCVVETARRRAGSIVLPELARVRLLGPGAARLPPSLRLAPLPARAEYGSGRLRVTALAPRHRLTLELAAEIERTALFEVVDPDREAAYAHRALGATATLAIARGRTRVLELALDGRYEWGARAGDPRVRHRAWST